MADISTAGLLHFGNEPRADNLTGRNGGLRAHHKWAISFALIARNTAEPTEVKHFVNNAPPETEVGTPPLMAFSLWRIQR